MSFKKIRDLDSYTNTVPFNTADWLAVADASGTTTRKISAADLVNAVGASNTFNGGTVTNSLTVDASVPQLTLNDTDEGPSELGNQAILSCNGNAFRVSLGNDSVPRLTLTAFNHPTDTGDTTIYSALELNSAIQLGGQRTSAVVDQLLNSTNDAALYTDLSGNLIYQKQANGSDVRLKLIGHTTDDVNLVGGNAAMAAALKQGLTNNGEIGYRETGRTQTYDGSTRKEKIGTNITEAQGTIQYQRLYSRVVINQFYTTEDSTTSNYGSGTATGLTNAASMGTTTGLVLQAQHDLQKNCIGPVQTMSGQVDLGATDKKFRDIYATNNVIQTSDRNIKQDIKELSEAEKRVANTCKSLIKRFRYKDAVQEKGDDARIHIGVIAQEIEQAFADQGLDGMRYGIICVDKHYKQMINGHFTGTVQSHNKFEEKIDANQPDTEGMTFEEEEIYSIRYDELIAFIISAL